MRDDAVLRRALPLGRGLGRSGLEYKLGSDFEYKLGSDLIVLIEAGPQIQAGFQKLVQLVSVLYKRPCTVY